MIGDDYRRLTLFRRLYRLSNTLFRFRQFLSRKSLPVSLYVIKHIIDNFVSEFLIIVCDDHYCSHNVGVES